MAAHSGPPDGRVRTGRGAGGTMNKRILLATVGAISAVGLSASAQTIEYNITVTGSGIMGVDGASTAFSNLTVEDTLYGDLTTVFNNTGVAQVIHLTSGVTT